MNDQPFDPAEERYVSLATYRRNGKEVRTPVWIAQAGRHYYVFSEGASGKVKRIRANGRARLAACNSRCDIQSEWLQVQGRVVEQRGVIERAYVALRDKYGWQMKIIDVFSKMTGKYVKRAIIELQVVQATHESTPSV